MLSTAEYAGEYRNCVSMDGVDRSEWVDHRCCRISTRARVRVYATHSTSQVVRATAGIDDPRATRDFKGSLRGTRDPFHKLLALVGLLARRQVDRRFELVRYNLQHGAGVPPSRPQRPADQQVVPHPYESDLVPDAFRSSTTSACTVRSGGALADWNEAWRSDQFTARSDALTLFIGATGMNGYDSARRSWMERFGIQINKNVYQQRC